MKVYAVIHVAQSEFTIENADAERLRFPLDGIDWPLQVDMPVLLDGRGTVAPYSGAFLDEDDGRYKKVEFENGHFVLRERPMPLSREERMAFIERLVRTNNPALEERLCMVIDDLLAEGDAELAMKLMNRQEALALPRRGASASSKDQKGGAPTRLYEAHP